VEQLTDLDAATDQVARAASMSETTSLQALHRARRGGGQPSSEGDRARRVEGVS
jgi:hypothetical protein